MRLEGSISAIDKSSFTGSSIDRGKRTGGEFRFSRSTTRGSRGPTRKHSDGIVFYRGEGRGNGITLDLGLHGKISRASASNYRVLVHG